MKYVAGDWTVEVIKRDGIEYFRVRCGSYFHGECKSVEQLISYMGREDFEKLEEVKK